MAKRATHGPGRELSRYERLSGFCYLPFHIFLLSFLLQIGAELLGISLSLETLNLLLYAISTAVILLIFHRFLLDSLHGIRFWSFVQTLILGFAFYYALNFALNLILIYLFPELNNPNTQAVTDLAETGGIAMIVCIVFLGPLIEEVLMRALLFGSLYRWNRYAAYAGSVLCFSAIHVWQFAQQLTVGQLLLYALQYIPGGIALAWTYEKSETIWCPVAVHAVINALAIGILKLV